VESQSRIGRETLDTLMVLRQIERAGVEVWGVREGRRISLKSDSEELLAMVESWRDASERRKVSPVVRSRAHQRHAQGFVATGKVYGYDNVRTCGGCGKTCKHPSVRVVNETQAAVVRRIFR